MLLATWVIAIAGIAAAIAAIVSTCYARRAIGKQQQMFDRQLSQYQLALSADTTLKFIERFESPHFKAVRSKGAKALLAKRDESDAEDIFDFFDTLWLFIARGALTEEIAYSVFFHWINLYWRAGKHYIGSKKMDTSSLWTGFEIVYNKVCEIEKRNQPDSEDLKMPEERLRRQLQEEIDLR